ncbi:uncharacterized protein LOC144621449 isoform X7 [Crassostrea virginica]
MRPSFWIIVLPLVTQTFSKEDSSWPSTVCSVNFYIKERKCTPCSDGFFGPNCSISCPFPSYGRRCLDGECHCSKELCDPRNGCVYAWNTGRQSATSQYMVVITATILFLKGSF